MTEPKWTSYPHGLSAEYHQAVGEICVRWSWIENQLSVIIREALRLQKPEGRMVTGGMSVSTLTTILEAISLAGVRGQPEISTKIGALVKRLKAIGDKRNNYAHALWGYENQQNPQLGVWIRKKIKHRIEPKWRPIKVQSIQKDAVTLSEIQAFAQTITDDLKAKKRGVWATGTWRGM